MSSRIALISACFLLLGLVAGAGVTEVKIDSGMIAGEMLDEHSGLTVYRGIPYVAPPVGELRWQPPKPVDSWEGVLEATEFGAICPQPGTLAAMSGSGLPDASEDCLFLNVWTTASAGQSLPVMVWIHGGGLNLGWSNQDLYDGVEMASRGVVLVTINYRLGPLGFLALPELSAESADGVSGNYGFLDQVAALEWVQRNIGAFGGDASNVTIFGESAGGTSVHALLATPMTEGLLHRAISESAWVTETNVTFLDRPTPFADSAEGIGETWVSSLVGEEGDRDLAALRAIPADEMIEKAGETFPPVIAVDGRFMPQPSEAIFLAGDQRDVPLIAGSNRDEGTMFAGMLGFRDAASYEKGMEELWGEQASQILKLYPAADGDELKATLNRFLTDTWFLRGTRTMLRGMEEVDSPAYQYHFTRASLTIPGWGAHHAAELGYVFNNFSGGFGGATEDRLEDADRRLGDAMIRYWVQFAKTGDPNVDGLPEWPQWKNGEEAYLELGDEIKVGHELGKMECDALDAIRAKLAHPTETPSGR